MAGTADLGTLLARMGIDTTDFDKAVAGISGKMQGLGKKMSSVGKKMTMGVSLPIAGAGAAAYKMSKDFEASMSNITGLVGVAGDQVAEWSDQILTEGAEWGRPPKELADALFFVTSAGIKGAQAMDVLEMSAKASSAGLGETAVIADLVTSAMNAYGMENLSAAQATDILVAAVREGKAEAPALAGAMGQVLPIASEMGVSFDQVGAAVAAMTRTGTDASSASMQLKNILTSLLKPTDQAEQALQNMGTSSADLRDKIKKDGIASALTELKSITSEYGETAMAEVFPNIRALSGVLDLMGANAADNIAIFDSLKEANGALEIAFEDASQTAEFKLNKAMGQMKSTLVEIGDSVSGVVTPIIEKLGERLATLGAWFNNLSDSQKELVVKMAAIAAAIGPVLLIVGKLTTGVGGMIGKVASLSKAIKAGTGIWGKMGKVIKKVTTIMMANPWMAIAAAVVAVGIAIAGLIKKLNEASAAEKALQEVQIASTQAVVKERVELEKLMRVAKSERSTKEQRATAIKKINDIMPDYLGNIDEETIKTGEAQTAINKYIKTLEMRARVEAAQEMLVEIEKKRIEAIQKGTDAQVNGWQKVGNFVLAAGDTTVQSMLNAKSATKNASKAEEEYIETKNVLLGVIEETETAIQENTDVQEDYNKSVNTGTAITTINTEANKSNITSQHNLGMSLAIVSEKLNELKTKYSEATTEQERNDIQKQIDEWTLLGDSIEIASSAITKFPKVEIPLNIKGTMPDIDEPAPELAPQNVQYTAGVTFLGDGLAELQAYDAAMRQLSEDINVNESATLTLQAQLDLTKTTLQELVEDGMNPTSDAIIGLQNTQIQLEAQLEEAEWTENWADAMEQANAIIESGVENMAIGLAEGIGAMAAGTASMSDIWNVLLGGVADMAIQLGRLAVTTGIAVKGIIKSLQMHPEAAIIGGLALIAIGSFVKNKMASIAEGTEGDGDMSIPGLAKGGVVDSPTMVMVGEYPGAKTNPEIITPENKMQSIFQDVLLQNLTNDSETNLNAFTSDLTTGSTLPDISYPTIPEKSLESVKTLFTDAIQNFTELQTTRELIGQEYILPNYTPPSKETLMSETQMDVNINTTQQTTDTTDQELVAEVRGEDIFFMLKKVDKRINRYG